MNLITKKKA